MKRKLVLTIKELEQPRFLTRKNVISLSNMMVREKHSPRFVAR